MPSLDVTERNFRSGRIADKRGDEGEPFPVQGVRVNEIGSVVIVNDTTQTPLTFCFDTQEEKNGELRFKSRDGRVLILSSQELVPAQNNIGLKHPHEVAMLFSGPTRSTKYPFQ